MSRAGSVSSTGVWIFRILTLAGAAGFLFAWFQPWWKAHIEFLKIDAVTVFPYQMIINMGDYPHWLAGAEMPPWFFRTMSVYMIACMVALAASLFAGESKFRVGPLNYSWPQWLVGAVGVSYIVFVVVFPIVVAIRATEFYNAPVQGSVFISKSEHEESYVTTSLLLGYWVACAVGPSLVILALLRDRIVGKLSPSVK